MNLRSFYVALSAVVIGSLLVAVVGFAWLAAQSPLSVLQGGERTDPEAAVFVPKQSPLVVSLLVNPDRLEALRIAIAPPEFRRRARKELEQFKQGILTERQLNYATDIRPWLGDEITLAVTTPDLDRDASNGLQPGYLLALEAQDGERARDFLQLFWQKQAIAGSDLIFEPFAGVKLIYGRAKGRALTDSSEPNGKLVRTLSTAVVGDRYVLFANSPKVLREAINNVQAPGLNLSSSKEYQTALERLPDRTFGLLYLNLPPLGQWLTPGRSAPKDAPETPSPFDRMIAGLQLNRHGVLADTSWLVAPEQELVPSQPSLTRPVAALQFIPEGTPVLVAGTHLPQIWEDLNQNLAEIPLLAELWQQALSPLEAQWGVPLSGDLLDWVERGFALGLMPQSSKGQDWVFVAEHTDATQPALERLDAIAQGQGLSIGPVPLNGQQTYTWTQLSAAEGRSRRKDRPQLEAEVRGVHAQVRNHEIFATSLDAIRQALPTPEHALIDQPDFQQAIAPIASQNDGYFYVDWQAIQPLLEKQIPLLKLAELSARPLFDHVRSFTLSSFGGDRQSRHGALFIRLSDR